MKEGFTFDDVLIIPKFSEIKSRKDVDLSTSIGNKTYHLPIVSANMDTVTEVKMANILSKYGAVGCLHRFWSIENNVKAFKEAPSAWVSVGVGELEAERAKALYEAGARTIVIDVANGAQQQIVEQYLTLKELCLSAHFVIGNFATRKSIEEFIGRCGYMYYADAIEDMSFKVGIGPGSACTTRIKTGVGVPQLSAIIDCVSSGQTIIADGGMKTPGDIAKALAAGAKMVMLGGMLAGTKETPVYGKALKEHLALKTVRNILTMKNIPTTEENFYVETLTYRGSASKESYEAQGKDESWRTAEGVAITIPYKGPVSEVLRDIEGGLRSAITYVGAKNLKEFSQTAEFIRVTGNSVVENNAHGKT